MFVSHIGDSRGRARTAVKSFEQYFIDRSRYLTDKGEDGWRVAKPYAGKACVLARTQNVELLAGWKTGVRVVETHTHQNHS